MLELSSLLPGLAQPVKSETIGNKRKNQKKSPTIAPTQIAFLFSPNFCPIFTRINSQTCPRTALPDNSTKTYQLRYGNLQYYTLGSRKETALGKKTMMDEIFFELFDTVSNIDARPNGDAFMKTTAQLYGLTNVAYLGINIPNSTFGNHFVQCTYSDEWVKHYVSNDYVSIDPVVRRGLTSLVPLDWSDIRRPTQRLNNMFREAEDFGVGKQGLTFPVRGLKGETAIFSINSDVNDKEWSALKKLFMRDFQILATFFHHQVLEENGNKIAEITGPLSPREVECLKWAAAGKTVWETSEILTLSERSVRFYLDQARHKMNCVSKTQAVARAVAGGFINIS